MRFLPYYPRPNSKSNFCCVVKLLKLPPCTCADTAFASIVGKLSVVGPSGVSCMIGRNGFSNTGNSGSVKLTLLNCASKLAIVSPAASNGSLAPIFAALSDIAEITSADKE